MAAAICGRGKNCISCPCFDHTPRHSPHHACAFMLCNHISAVTMQKGSTMRPVTAHASQNDSKHIMTEVLDKGCQGDVHCRPYTMHGWLLIQCNSFIVINRHMKSSRCDQHLPHH